MLRDVFYYGAKPNVHPREQFANNLSDARKKCTTEHFWIVNEYCDYTNFDWDFDFDFLPDEDVWAQDHNNVWPSQHQKDSGTWLCSKIESDIIIYRTDVSPVKRKNEKNSFWKIYTPIDEKKFDFSWHPDPTDPLFIFVWGNKYINGVFEPTVEYHTPGATEKKYMFQHAPVLPQWERWHILKEVDKTTFDFTWRPDPREPAYIYVWGNKYEPAEITPTLEYHCPGATQVKYMTTEVDVLPQWDLWEIPDNVDKSSFDFTWRPDPREPALIYEFGTQWQKTGGPRYVMPEATEVKYIDVQYAKVLPNTSKDNWIIPDNIDVTTFDFSWHPDSTEEPYIYQFGTQHQKTGGPRYVVKNATQIKYIDVINAKALPNKDKWIVPDNLDVSEFDFSWHPDDTEPPFIYDAGTQWQKTGGPRYVVEGATQLKYLENKKAKALPNRANWHIPVYIDESAWDFSWHPDITEPAYIYYFPTQWALSGGPVYTVPGGTENKFLEGPVAKAVINMDNWEIPDNIDKDSFDFSWHPFAQDDPCIYQIGTQWQKTGGPRYITPGTNETSPVKYIDRRIIKSKILPDKTNFKFLHPIVEEEFDFSWHPDSTEEPYTYIFGNQHWGAEKMHTVEYHVEGATQYKYVHNLKAKLKPNRENWQIKINIDESAWDFSWVPDPGEPPYIYVFGNQWHNAEIESTIEYHVPGATEYKYVNDIKATVLPDMTNWKFNYKIDESKFDFSWRPDPGSPPYIYSFGSNLYPAEEMSTVEYHVPGATDYKFVPEIVAQLAQDKSKWIIPGNVDVADFDFSWHPNPKDPKYIYYAGTQWQKTGGPKYVVEGAIEIKYLEGKKVKALPDKTNWTLPTNVDVADFDFSWHPDETEPPYIYQFGTQWALSGGPKYVMPNATEVKYMENPVAKAIPDKTNWIIPKNIDANSFDFSWHPYVEDQPYIYVFGTQWQKTGGPRYVTPGASEMSPVKYIDRRIIKSKRLPDKTNWEIPANIDPNSVDYSWHPDDTEQPYIYEFGTQWHDRGGPKYVVPDATVMKYSSDIKGNLIRERKNWEVLTPIIESKFDFTWHPHPNDPPYIYVFGNNLYPAEEMETVRYVVEGSTQVKYVNDVVAQLAPDRSNWEVPKDVDVSEFDFSWRPHPKAPPYIYEFGTQWQKTGGPRYIVEGAKEVNYISGSKAVYKPKVKSKYWDIPKSLDIREFDFSWHPDSTDKPYIYQFGTQWALSGGPRFVVPGATEVKYIDKPVAKMRGSKKNWEIPNDIDVNEFDFSWHPYEDDRPYIYQFGTQWQKTGGPRYVTPGADEMSAVKYIDRRILKAKKLPNKSKFKILGNTTVEDFDYSWHPDATEEPYIYVFGNNQYPAEIMPTLEYRVKGATQIKYVSDIVATLGEDKTNWEIPENIDVSNIDFSWKPNPKDPPYIYQFGTQWQKTGGPRYVVGDATEVKYVESPNAIALPNKNNFNILNEYVIADFDYSWHPDYSEEPYIYVFGNEKYSAEIMPTVQYTVEGAQTKKYISDVKAKLGVNMSNWKFVDNVDKTKFDFSWVPDPNDPPYIYTWGSKYIEAELKPTLEYHVPGAKERKYMQETVDVLPEWDRWVEIIPVDKVRSAENGFDFSWRPDPREPAFIYVFGNQWNRAEIEPTLEYRVPGATEKKYVHTSAAYVLPNREKFEILLDITDFDFSWRPDPNDPPYIYVFGNQWNKAEKEPTIKYKNKDGSDVKYINDVVATVASNMKMWQIPEGFAVENFDFSWRPDPYDPAYIYEFATEYSDRGGPKYVVDGATETKYMSHIKAKLKATAVPKYYIETTLEDLISWHPTETFWALQKSIRYDNFDFNWRPTQDIEKYINVFGSPDSEMTQTYFINATHYLEGNTDKNYIQQETRADSEYLAELFVQPDIFFVDRGNPESQQRFEQLKARFTNISKTRFLNSWVDTINRCINRSNTELCWILNSELDYTDFDFKYYPNPWQMKMVHVFGTQWSHWGTTFMVNRETFSEDTKYIKIIEHLSNLNFVKDRRAKATNNLYDIYVINHGNKELNQVVDSIKLVVGDKSVNVVDYDKTYLQTIKNIVDNIVPRKEHYIWICSSICNYSNFDFTYICDPFARENLHVFPSDMQKFGDTFFINVNHTKKVINELEILQQYNKVNFNNTVRSKRLPAPVIKVSTDTHVGSIDTNFDFPYAIFTTEEFKSNDTEPLNLWQDDTKQLLVTSTGASRIIVPKEAKNYIKNELYDYPYIKTASKLLSSKPLDIVFLSNGEKNAEENYKHLLAVTEGLKNRVVRVDGVNGRVDAYHAAVKASETPWAFTVFAKLKVNGKFDWGWQPDRLQVPKHYIFHAKNPVNGLEYGHQGMIAYNKQLVLNNFGSGLDFTLDDPHETVELVSGTANFNTDAYSTWRTAFREVIKLKSDYTEISQERLNIWLTEAKGKFAKDCLQGAKDAVEYYEEVSGDMDQLKLSYEWSWLKDFYNRKYK